MKKAFFALAGMIAMIGALLLPAQAMAAPVTPDVKVSVNAKTEAQNGTVVVAVYARNNDTIPVDIRLSTPFGEKKFNKVQPGQAAYERFDSGQTVVAAGSATIAAYKWVDGAGKYSTFSAPYAALDVTPVPEPEPEPEPQPEPAPVNYCAWNTFDAWTCVVQLFPWLS
jgi:hypothetical protein